MKTRLRLTIAGLIATGLASFSAPTHAQPANSFECRSDDDVNFTVALARNGAVSDPIVVWTSDAFSNAGYTPERRCQAVTGRLNTLLDDNGNSLDGLYLTVGRVNGQSVVCSVASTRGGCNSDNVLFTLSGSNSRNPERVLYGLASRSTGTSIQESGGVPYVDLEELVNASF
ncbi:MAG: COP23 domain-containing protein [Geitlerinemataceae cyanobacterium]